MDEHGHSTDATREALGAARAVGVRISLDLNYRAKLWGTDRAREVMRPLASMVDVIIANEEDIQACLGLEVHGADVTAGRLDLAGYRDVAERVAREFGKLIPGPRFERIKLREILRGTGGESRAVAGAGGDEGVANDLRRPAHVGDAVPPVRVFAVMRVVAVIDGELERRHGVAHFHKRRA